MARPVQTEIRLRLIIDEPVPGVAHSLQDKNGQPVDAKTPSTRDRLTFDFPIRVSDGPRFFGDHVRSEGPERRFVYIAVGQQAGQGGSLWSRRMKIDVHDIPATLIDEAKAGKTIEGVIAGTAPDGTPASASVPLTKSWRAV